MDKKLLTPQARRTQDAPRARAKASQLNEGLPLWHIAALVITGVVLLALI